MRSFLILLMLTAPVATVAQPLSVTASVAVTWLDRVDAEPDTLICEEPVSLGSVFPPAVVVLWRGQPGWAFEDATEKVSFSSSGGFGDEIRSTSVTQGRVGLELTYDPETRTARVNGLPVQLPAGDDVILVDNVDDQPAVVGTLSVGGSVPELIEEFLGRDPAVTAFVRCDVSLPEDAFPGKARIRRGLQRTLDERCQLIAGTHPGSGLCGVPLELLPLELLPQ